MLYFIAFCATKMVLYATVIPFEIGETVHLSLAQEIIRMLINMTEILFLYQCLRSKNNFTEEQSYYKIVTIGLGWSLAESLFGNLFYYFMNAMGEEFTWEYIRTAILSNVDMVEKLAIVALIQSIQRSFEENRIGIHLIFFVIAKYVFNNFGYNYIKLLNFDGDQWKVLGSKVGITFIFGIIAKKLYRNVNKTDDEKAEEEYLKMKKKTE